MSSAAPRSDSIRRPASPRHREAVVLRGDRDVPGREVLDRVVGAAVAERELERLQPGRAGQQLVAEADAEHRLAHQQRADRLDDVVERRRVAGAGHEEEPVGVARQQLVGGRRARVQLELHAALHEVAHDRALDAGVERDDAQSAALALDLWLRQRHLAREVSTDHRGLGEHELARLGRRHVAGEDPAAHRARRADVPDERARVDAGDPRDAVGGQPVEPALVGAGRVGGVDRLAHDRPGRVDAVGLVGARADPVVADVRRGEGDDLAREARVGHRLLVARHAGREHHLAGHVATRADGVAVEALAVLEQDVGAHATTLNARSR